MKLKVSKLLFVTNNSSLPSNDGPPNENLILYQTEHLKRVLLKFLVFEKTYQFPQKLSKIAVADGISHRHGGVLVKVFN